MLESQREQAERRRVLAQDASLREQTGTFMSHTHSDAGGRFSAVGAANVVGSTQFPQYPAAGPHQSDPCELEPPLVIESTILSLHLLLWLKQLARRLRLYLPAMSCPFFWRSDN